MVLNKHRATNWQAKPEICVIGKENQQSQNKRKELNYLNKELHYLTRVVDILDTKAQKWP